LLERQQQSGGEQPCLRQRLLGIKVNNAFYVNNVVIKNTVSGNGANNYIGLTGNDFGPIGTAATRPAPGEYFSLTQPTPKMKLKKTIRLVTCGQPHYSLNA